MLIYQFNIATLITKIIIMCSRRVPSLEAQPHVIYTIILYIRSMSLDKCSAAAKYNNSSSVFKYLLFLFLHYASLYNSLCF